MAFIAFIAFISFIDFMLFIAFMAFIAFIAFIAFMAFMGAILQAKMGKSPRARGDFQGGLNSEMQRQKRITAGLLMCYLQPPLLAALACAKEHSGRAQSACTFSLPTLRRLDIQYGSVQDCSPFWSPMLDLEVTFTEHCPAY